EIALIEAYLPRQMSHAEVEAVVEATMQRLGVTDLKGMGKVMGVVMGQLKGKADGGLVNQVVREKLQPR
ncbi:MAG: GatB/YqeY domain-containing protein, partial [Anaerolineales bacterium]|nr:GatB/YqeY domain-containing protein [Anaerolineales bacterium]